MPRLAAFDAYWQQVGFTSRRSAIRHCMQVAIAQHAAHEQRGRARAADPNRWQRPWSPDDRTAAESRPITADLADLI